MVRGILLKPRHEPNRAYVPVFKKDPEKLAEMLERYKRGESPTQLGIAYGVHHTSIIYQVRKADIWQKEVRRPMPVIAKPPLYIDAEDLGKPKGKAYKYQSTFDQEEKRCAGKNYIEYAAEAAQRMFDKFKNCGPYPAELLNRSSRKA